MSIIQKRCLVQGDFKPVSMSVYLLTPLQKLVPRLPSMTYSPPSTHTLPHLLLFRTHNLPTNNS